MINIGIIGNINELNTLVHEISQNHHLVGYASTSRSLSNTQYSIAEMNKIELIERSDALILDDSVNAPYPLMRDIIKRTKHIFFYGTPNLSINECEELGRLTLEAGTILQIYNPYYFHEATQWINQNVRPPIFAELTQCIHEFNPKTLSSALLTFLQIPGITPKKISAQTFINSTATSFTIIKLDYNNASTLNLHFITPADENKAQLKIYAHQHFTIIDFTKNKFIVNNKNIPLLNAYNNGGFHAFLESINTGSAATSTIDDYHAILLLTDAIFKKLTLLSS